jgi:diguanylate cyclase (GGDEF)-like protein/PAS domain S-box-containing protein
VNANIQHRLRALIVEDNSVDAELMLDQLKEAGYSVEWTRVETEADYLAALATAPDVILSDYNLPRFNGLRALTLLKEQGLDTPFILVSGTVGEDIAVAAMVAGARDYVLKDKLTRLAPALERELRASALRRDRRETQKQLEQKTRDLAERVKELTCLYTVSGLVQQSELPLEELFDGTLKSLVLAYQWPDYACARITHGNTVRQTANFRLTPRKQEARLIVDGATAGSITVCYLQAPSASATKLFLVEEQQMLDAVADRVSHNLADRRLRAALIESERKSRVTFNQAAVGIVRADLERNILDANQKFCELTGYSLEELLRMTVIEISHPDDRGQDTELRTKLLAGEFDHFRSEKRYLRKDGGTFWVRRTTSLARDAANEEPHYIIVVEDITDRKATEESYRATFDRAPVGIMHSSLDSRILQVNPRLCEILGYSREELEAMTLADIIPPDYRGIEQAKFLEPMLAGKIENFSSERPFLHKNGSTVWVNRHISLVRDAAGQPLYFLRTIEDISGKKHMEDQLIQERQLLRTVIDAMPERIFVKDREGRFLLQNAANLKVRGLEKQDDIVGKTVYDIYPRALAEHRDAEDRAIIESGVPLLNREGETYFGKADKRKQETRWHLTSKIPLKDASGRIYGIAGINHDITEQKLAAIALEESERFAKSTIDALSKHLCVLDENGTIIAVNKAWRDFAAANGDGQPTDHCLDTGANYLAACDNATGDSAAQGREFAAGIRAVLRGELKNFTLEYPCHSPTEQRWFFGKVSPFHGTGPRRVVVTHEDISKRKQAEIELRTTQEKLKTAIRSTNLGLWDWDLKTDGIQYSTEWKSQLGYTEDEINDSVDAARNLMHPEDIDRTFEQVAQCVSGATQEFETEFRMRHKDGSYRWLLSQGKVYKDEQGKLDRFVGGHLDITERKQAEQQIRRLNQLYSTLSQTNAAIVRIKNRDELFKRICQIAVEQNQFALTWIGMTEEATGMIRPISSAGTKHWYLDDLRLSIDATAPEGHGTSSVAVREGRTVVCNDIANEPKLAPWHKQTRAAGLNAVASLPLKTAGKTVGVLTFMAKDSAFFDADLIRLLEEMAEDISFALDNLYLETKHQQTEKALLDSDEKFRELAKNIPQLFWMTDAEQRSTIYASPAYETISGRPVSELEAEPQAWLRAIHAEDRERVQRARKERAPLGTYDIEYRVLHTQGGVRWIHDRAFPVRSAAGHVYRIAGIAEDITERKLAEEQLANLAHFDSLTGLPNRVLFNDRLRQAVAQAKRNHWIVGVLFLDLDRFKLVNDTLGHACGDLLLKQVAERLSACLRPTDTVGRLSGDEFAVILSELAETQNASYVAQKILDALAAPFNLEGSEVFVTASIGITLYPSDSDSIDTLVRDADAAMYSAKSAGRNNYQYYTAAMNARATEKLKMETGIRRALERNELLLHYQPKIDIASGKVCGLEALLRWQSPEHGLVSPAKFIPLLEETGLIVPVGEWVTRASCAQLQAWRKAGLSLMPVAINLSARQLRQQGYARVLEQAMKDFDVNPELIRIEITESSLMENPEEAIIVLQELKALGIRLDADDFGTGYSSLSYLKRFPLDALKIDRSFVRDITSDEDDAVIAQTVITLAHSLGLKVVAEGVETEAQLEFLSAHHCDEAQGYLFAKPMDMEACTELLATGLPPRSTQQVRDAELAPAVLLVDDDARDIELNRLLLQKDGHKILTATNTHNAFKLLAVNRVGIVISDQNMPEMSGVEFLKQVKLMYPDIVRIMLSGGGDFETATAAINEGEVHKFFVKGRDGELLRREIQRKIWHAPVHDIPVISTSPRRPGRPQRRLTTD